MDPFNVCWQLVGILPKVSSPVFCMRAWRNSWGLAQNSPFSFTDFLSPGCVRSTSTCAVNLMYSWTLHNKSTPSASPTRQHDATGKFIDQRTHCAGNIQSLTARMRPFAQLPWTALACGGQEGQTASLSTPECTTDELWQTGFAKSPNPPANSCQSHVSGDGKCLANFPKLQTSHSHRNYKAFGSKLSPRWWCLAIRFRRSAIVWFDVSATLCIPLDLPVPQNVESLGLKEHRLRHFFFRSWRWHVSWFDCAAGRAGPGPQGWAAVQDRNKPTSSWSCIHAKNRLFRASFLSRLHAVFHFLCCRPLFPRPDSQQSTPCRLPDKGQESEVQRLEWALSRFISRQRRRCRRKITDRLRSVSLRLVLLFFAFFFIDRSIIYDEAANCHRTKTRGGIFGGRGGCPC